MRIGVVLPQTEIGPEVGAVRRYGQGVEDLGFQHVLAYDHVVGADPAVHQPWNGPYDIDTQFHEPFVLFGFLAGCTSLDLVTGITILPQRQTALVAKQAAEVDLLTRGGFRLGVGHRVEPRGVRGARAGLHHPRPTARGAGRPAPPLLDGAVGDGRRRVRPGDRCRDRAAARAAPHPGLVRRDVARRPTSGWAAWPTAGSPSSSRASSSRRPGR